MDEKTMEKISILLDGLLTDDEKLRALFEADKQWFFTTIATQPNQTSWFYATDNERERRLKIVAEALQGKATNHYSLYPAYVWASYELSNELQSKVDFETFVELALALNDVAEDRLFHIYAALKKVGIRTNEISISEFPKYYAKNALPEPDTVQLMGQYKKVRQEIGKFDI